MAKQGRWLAREAEMRAVLTKWERSDLPLSQFARREGVAVKTLYRWRRRLGGDSPGLHLLLRGLLSLPRLGRPRHLRRRRDQVAPVASAPYAT